MANLVAEQGWRGFDRDDGMDSKDVLERHGGTEF